jgi:hypothetical protein
LVGLPLAGVFGVLTWGERLEAPASARGRWQFEQPETAPAAKLCAPAPEAGQVLTIVQSGRALHLAWGDVAETALVGHLDGVQITARENRGPAILTATLNQVEAATRLEGTLTSAECAEAVSVSAVRLPLGK